MLHSIPCENTGHAKNSYPKQKKAKDDRQAKMSIRVKIFTKLYEVKLRELTLASAKEREASLKICNEDKTTLRT